VSPRTEEFLAAARDALRGARLTLEGDVPGRAASSAYYAMLYAARAALSEEDENARTHGGTWGLFHREFVVRGHFDEELFKQAHATQEIRELSDYEAEAPPTERAGEIVALAERFVAAVEAMLD
jgi:uncharacterized protein (UPF0332 family)